MNTRIVQIRIGAMAIIAAAVLVLIGIPNWVSSPSNVPKIVLSPLFWPYLLGGITGLVGLALILTSGGRRESMQSPDTDWGRQRAGFLRLFAIAIVMVATMMAVPYLGMVWTTMLVFVAVAFLVRTSHPITALICAFVIPLVLYAFFAHAAGVGIPQGDFVRLP